jgi:cysteine desulfurase/selenocysteine lyase
LIKDEIREDFPILNRKRNGKPLIYLDNAATSFKPKKVIDVVNDYYKKFTSNVHRGIYNLSQEATNLYEDSREKVAKFINAKHASEIVFTRGTTEAINLIAYGLNWKEGDEVITTVMEHHSNIVPWQIIRDRFNVKVKYVDITNDYHLNISTFEEQISSKTKLVTLTHLSNVLGTINSVKEFANIAHEYNAFVLVDAAQSVPHMPVNVKEINCDFLAFSAHKMLGPTGIGALYIKRGTEEEINPPFGGGEMIKNVSLQSCTWNDMPLRFEPGTPNIAGAIGFGAAIDYLKKLGMNNVRSKEIMLTNLALKRLNEINKIEVYGPKFSEERGGIVSFNVRLSKDKIMNGHDLALMLDELENIAIRSGLHCAEPLHKRLGINGSVRASFYIYNTKDEVNKFCDVLEAIIKQLS